MNRFPVRRSVVVNLKSGSAFRAILWATRGPLHVLKNATLVEGGATVELDGEVIVERKDVDFIQVLPA